MTALRVTREKVYHPRCERCGHTWDTLKVPIRCAGCKSPYWRTKAQRKQSGRK